MKEHSMLERQKTASVATVTVVAAVVGAIFGSYVVNRIMHPDVDVSVERMLVDASNQVNKMLPMMVDSETRADSTIPEPPNTLVYHYTLLKRTKSELDVRAIADYLRPRLVNNYKTTENMKTLRDAGVMLKYRYYDKDGIFVAEIVVKTSDLN
jgi:hypothetical protein